MGMSDPRLSCLESCFFFPIMGRLSFLVAVADVHSLLLCREVLSPPDSSIIFCDMRMAILSGGI